MTHISAECDQILGALALAQAKIDNVTQDREVEVPIKDKQTGQQKGKYKFRYATLAGILNHIREPLTAHGLWFTQRIEDGHMVTRIIHGSGQWMDTGHLPVPNIKGTPQDIGSVNSYFRRYSLGSAFGLASEEDNDGEMGDREVSFRARGERRDHDEPRDVATGVDEPEEGWSAWSLSLAAEVDKARDEAAIDKLRDDNKRLINGIAKVDKAIYASLQSAFVRRRQAVKPNEGF